MKITAAELLSLGVIEGIIPEETPASMDTIDGLSAELRQRIGQFLAREEAMEPSEILEERYSKFRNL